MMKYKIEKREFGPMWVKVIGENAKKETMVIELTHCENSGTKNSLPYLWWKEGWTDKVMETWIGCSTYVTDSEGGCRGAYDITSKRSDDGKRNVINFDWLLEDTEENRKKIIEECINLFESATGKSATEIKEEKIFAYAKENNMKVYRELPEGWEIFRSMCCPVGSERIIKGNPSVKRWKNTEKALLIL